jgi:hypothetical protein
MPGGPRSFPADLVIFDTSGKRVYERAYKANLAGFSISPCGRYVASQTCNSGNEDSFILEFHDVAQQRILASCTPVAGWSAEYPLRLSRACRLFWKGSKTLRAF